MALRPLNSIAGFSTGDPAITIVQANGDITTTNLFANGLSNLGNVGNLTLLGGSNGQALITDGAGNLTWGNPANTTSNRAAVMPYLIANGESYIVNENFQGLYSQSITIDGELEVDGILIEVPISFDAEPTQVLFANNGNPTGNSNFTFTAATGNLAVPGNISVKGNVIPYENDTFDLGTSSYRWRNGYFGGNTIYLDTATISVDANGFVVITNELGGQFIVEGNTVSGTNEIENGNSNVTVYANSNVAVTVNGISNILVVTTAGANLTGNLTTDGVKTDNLYYANGQPWDLQQPAGSNTQIQFNNNDNFGASANFTFSTATNNLTVTGNIVTNTGAIYGNAAGLTNIPGGNVSGQVANALVAGTVYTAAQPNITSVGTLSSLAVTADITAGNVYANTGNAQFANLTVTGVLNAADIVVNTLEDGNSNVIVSPNGNVSVSVTGTANVLVVTNTGANISGTANVSGNLSAANVAGGNIVSANYLVSNSGCVAVGTGLIAVSGTTGGIFTGTIADINLGLAANTTIGSTTGNTTIRGNLVANNNIWANAGTVVANLVTANLFTGTLTTAAQPNITSLGTLTALTVSNTVQTTGTVSNRSNKAVTTSTVIDSFDANTYRSAKYVIKSENDNGYESLEVLLIHNNINSYITIYAAINDGGGNTVSITTGISSGNVELYATGLAANTVVNLIGTYVPD